TTTPLKPNAGSFMPGRARETSSGTATAKVPKKLAAWQQRRTRSCLRASIACASHNDDASANNVATDASGSMRLAATRTARAGASAMTRGPAALTAHDASATSSDVRVAVTSSHRNNHDVDAKTTKPANHDARATTSARSIVRTSVDSAHNN